MNDAEREEWVWNDEGLYELYLSWVRHNKGGMRGFIREHRKLIDDAVEPVISGEKRQHHLKYGD